MWPFTRKRTITAFRFRTEFRLEPVWKPFERNLHSFERPGSSVQKNLSLRSVLFGLEKPMLEDSMNLKDIQSNLPYGHVQPPKWYRPRNDPHFSSPQPRNDPQIILGMELVFRHGIITNLLQRLRSYIAFNISLQIENVTVKNSIFPSSLPMRPARAST